MRIQQLTQYAPVLAAQTTLEVDEEIREELQFHLDMRTRDNVRSGMPLDLARRDAQRRFGDFEAKRQACRQITLGPRLMLQRIQAILLPVLLIAVVCLGVRLVQMQAESKAQMETLRATIEQLQTAQSPSPNPDAIIPYRQWERITPVKSASEPSPAEGLDPLVWVANDYSPDQPWSDWGPLEEISDGQ